MQAANLAHPLLQGRHLIQCRIALRASGVGPLALALEPLQQLRDAAPSGLLTWRPVAQGLVLRHPPPPAPLQFGSRGSQI